MYTDDFCDSTIEQMWIDMKSARVLTLRRDVVSVKWLCNEQARVLLMRQDSVSKGADIQCKDFISATFLICGVVIP